MPVPEGQKLVMCAFIKIQHHNVTDGQQKWYRARLTRDQGVSHAASTESLTAKPICLAVLCFYSKTGF